MTRRRGTQHLKRRRGGYFQGRHDGMVGVTLAVALDIESIPAAKQRTHDSLIRLMGPARTGGVEWRILPRARALEVWDELDRDGAWTAAGYLHALETHPGAFLVAATAPGVPGWETP